MWQGKKIVCVILGAVPIAVIILNNHWLVKNMGEINLSKLSQTSLRF